MIRNKNGATIMEAFVAMILVAIVTISAASYFAFCERSIVASQSRLMEVNYARETMEKYYMNNTAYAGNYNDNLPAGDLRDRDGGTRTYTISAPVNGYQIITVTVNSNR